MYGAAFHELLDSTNIGAFVQDTLFKQAPSTIDHPCPLIQWLLNKSFRYINFKAFKAESEKPEQSKKRAI